MPKSPARTVYEACDLPRPLPEAATVSRQIADQAWEDIRDAAAAAGITLPKGDRAEGLVTFIFAHLIDATDIDVFALARTIEADPE